MSIQLGNLPSTASALVDGQGRATPVLQQFFAAIKRGFAAVPAGSTVQGDIWQNSMVRVAEFASGAGSALGLPVPAATTYPGATSTSYYASLVRGRYTTAAVAGMQSGYNGALLCLWRGNAAGRGGFRAEFRFGVDTTVATTRIGVGLATGPLALNVNDPSATLNCILVGADAADTTLQVMSNDGAGVATKVNLGASFPITNDAVYRAVFTATANASSVAYTVTREDSTAVATGTISTDLPSSTTFMGPVAYVGNGATAAAASMGLIRILTQEPPPA